MELLSVKETAEKFNISERRVQKLCENGRISGAQRISNVWLIPQNAEKPIDERCSIKMENMLTLNDLCNELSISLATGRNWIKLGKLIPSSTNKKTCYFTKDYCSELKKEIFSGKNAALKSRRNKKYVSGNDIYNSYISDSSENIKVVQNLLNTLQEENIEVDESLIIALIADAALQIIADKNNYIQVVNLLNYKDAKSATPYTFLIEDLISISKESEKTVIKYPKLFTNKFIYEKNEDILGLIYISLKNIGNRKATGVYYTPTNVVRKLCTNLFTTNDLTNKTILDPCCGTGNFILQLPEQIPSTCVYGNDIDEISVLIARINYALKYETTNKKQIYSHITKADYLTEFHNNQFDFVIGNPPWGYDFSENEKLNLRNTYKCATGNNIESYDVFVEKALNTLSANGVLSFVLPEAFLNVKAHAPVRQILINKNSIQYIEFLGNAFDKVQCPCIILQIIHTNRPFSSIGLVVNDGNRSFSIQNERKISSEYFSFMTSDEEYRILQKIETGVESTNLLGQSEFALGIVTGNNKNYISTTKTKQNEIVLKGSDLFKYRKKEATNYITFKPDSFQQVAPAEMYRAKEKLLYRFICNQLVFAYDDKQTLSLNSCNILIPHIPGLDIKYILAILNSRIAQFYFKKQFNSVKVLRSHIEQIPIPVINAKRQHTIIAMVDSILAESSLTTINNIYNKIDKEIADTFNLTEAEYQIINNVMANDNLFLE